MFVVKVAEPKEIKREVSLKQRSDGVVVIINGLVVLRLDDDDDRIIFVGGLSKAITGLHVTGCGCHATYTWDEDKETSKVR